MGNLFSSNVNLDEQKELVIKANKFDELKVLKQKQIRLLLEHLRIQLQNLGFNIVIIPEKEKDNKTSNIEPSYLQDVLNNLYKQLERLQHQQLEHELLVLQPQLQLLQLQPLELLQLQLRQIELHHIKKHHLPLFLIYWQLQQEFLELILMYPKSEVQ
jgi:hypothetical protein